MKIIYLNIFEGCEKKERFNKICAFIKKEKPDVLGLSELHFWEKNNFEKLKLFQKNTGFQNAYFCKANSDENLCLFSNSPMTKIIKVREGFEHGMIKATMELNGELITVILTHLTADNVKKRIKEIQIVLNNINKNEKSILIGDLNSLSPLDNYNDEDLIRKLKEANVKKFGINRLKKEVQSKILNWGMIDTIRKFSDEPEYSVPTTYNQDENHVTKLRLDYIFITKSLNPFIQKAKILRTEETNQLSDHFPIIAEFDF